MRWDSVLLQLKTNVARSPKWLPPVTFIVVIIMASNLIMESSGKSTSSLKASRQFLLGVLRLPIVHDTLDWNDGESITKTKSSYLMATGRARPSLCSGKRLDAAGFFHPDNYITAGECAALGGNCCNLSPAWGFASNDPHYMKSSDGCHGCYDTNVTARCAGSILRTRHRGNEQNDDDDDDDYVSHQVTSKNCIQLGGQCCDMRIILPGLFGSGVGVFDPREYPEDETCSNCYSGAPFGLGCTGNLLQSELYTGDTCSQFQGKCCQGIYGVFDPVDYPDRDCSSCFSGSLQLE